MRATVSDFRAVSVGGAGVASSKGSWHYYRELLKGKVAEMSRETT